MGIPPFSVMRKKVLPLMVVAIVAIVAWRMVATRQSAKHGFGDFDRPTPVATVTVTRGDLNLFLSGLGTVIPANAVTVKSRVDGQLLRVHFKEGQLVKAGDLLAEIDPRPFEVQLAQAEAQLARDTALLKNAQIDLERYDMLWSQDSIAKQQVDAQAAQVRQYDATTKVDAAQVADAKLQLTYAKITAPVSGRVGLRQIDPGNIVHASDANGIVSIAQLQPIYVVFTLPEDNLPRLLQKLNNKQSIAIDALDRSQKMKLGSGALVALDNQIDTSTGTVKVKAEFKNEESALFPNQFVNVTLPIATARNVILVPVAAVQHGAQGDFVYTAQPDKTAQLRNVRIGESDATQVVIEEGIEPNMQVIVEGAEQLRDGNKIDVVEVDGKSVASDNSENKSATDSKDAISKEEGNSADAAANKARRHKKPAAL